MEQGSGGLNETRYYILKDSSLFSPYRGEHTLRIQGSSNCSEEIKIVFNDEIFIEYNIVQYPICGSWIGEVNFTASNFFGEHSFQTNMMGKPTQSGDHFNIQFLSPGDYYIIARDEIGCTRVDFPLTNLESSLSLAIKSITDTNSSTGELGSVSLSGSGGQKPYRFIRSIENMTDCAPGHINACLPIPFYPSQIIPDSVFKFLPKGMYTFRMMDVNNCYSDVVSAEIN